MYKAQSPERQGKPIYRPITDDETCLIGELKNLFSQFKIIISFTVLDLKTYSKIKITCESFLEKENWAEFFSTIRNHFKCRRCLQRVCVCCCESVQVGHGTNLHKVKKPLSTREILLKSLFSCTVFTLHSKGRTGLEFWRWMNIFSHLSSNSNVHA